MTSSHLQVIRQPWLLIFYSIHPLCTKGKVQTTHGSVAEEGNSQKAKPSEEVVRITQGSVPGQKERE